MRQRIIPFRFGVNAHAVFREYSAPITLVHSIPKDMMNMIIKDRDMMMMKGKRKEGERVDDAGIDNDAETMRMYNGNGNSHRFQSNGQSNSQCDDQCNSQCDGQCDGQCNSQCDGQCDDTSQHNVCPICLQSYKSPVMLIPCQHAYCLDCLMSWFQLKLQCPLCKSNDIYFLQWCTYNGREDELMIWNPSPNKIIKQSLSEMINPEIVGLYCRRFPSKIIDTKKIVDTDTSVNDSKLIETNRPKRHLNCHIDKFEGQDDRIVTINDGSGSQSSDVGTLTYRKRKVQDVVCNQDGEYFCGDKDGCDTSHQRLKEYQAKVSDIDRQIKQLEDELLGLREVV